MLYLWNLERNSIKDQLRSKNPLPDQVSQTLELCLLHLLLKETTEENRSLDHHLRQNQK